MLITKTYKVSDLLYMWLETKKNIKLQSLLNYKYLIEKYINYYLGNIYNLKKDDILFFFEQLEVSISTKKKILYILKATLHFSYYHKYMNEFIDMNDIKFQKEIKTIYILSKEEQITLENYLKNNINIRKICVLLCLYTGLRLGEVSGLRWQDIDFDRHSLFVKRTIVRIKKDGKSFLIESTPKSDTSNRIVPIPRFLMEILRRFKDKDNYYLLSKNTKLYDPRLLESFYKRILEKCDITYNKFHTLRHTFATRCVESKMDIKTLSEILGHSSIEITLKLYVHPSYEMKRVQLENFVKYMGQN